MDLNLPGFGSVVWFRPIQTGRPLSSPSVSDGRRVSLSDSGESPPRLSMNVPVQSNFSQSCCMSSDPCCGCRCQGGYLCCRVGRGSPPLCLSLSPSLSFFPPLLLWSLYLSTLSPVSPSLSSFPLFHSSSHWHVSGVYPLCASLAMRCFLYLA